MVDALTQRGQYIPPSGNYPQELPDYWRFSDNTLRTDLPELTDEQLAELSWIGPIAMPPLEGTSYFTHSYEWNSETLSFDATELDEFEKRRRVNYQLFWDLLLNKAAYSTIKVVSSQSLEVNTLTTEFIAFMSDAKRGKANVEKIQQILTEIVSGIPFTPEELAEIQEAFTRSGMFVVYTLQ
jgi:hypothetical protein